MWNKPRNKRDPPLPYMGLVRWVSASETTIAVYQATTRAPDYSQRLLELNVGTATLTRGHNYVVSRSFTFPLAPWAGGAAVQNRSLESGQWRTILALRHAMWRSAVVVIKTD